MKRLSSVTTSSSPSRRVAYREEDQLFVDAVVEGKAPPVTAQAGYRAVELVWLEAST